MTSDKRRYRLQIRSLRERIADHERKILEERQKPQPIEERIRHWEVEIQVWQKTLDKRLARLRRRRK